MIRPVLWLLFLCHHTVHGFSGQELPPARALVGGGSSSTSVGLQGRPNAGDDRHPDASKWVGRVPTDEPSNDDGGDDEHDDPTPLSRRRALFRTLSKATVGAAAVTAVMASMSPPPSGAFDRTFPTELTEVDAPSRTVTVGSRTTALQRKEAAQRSRERMDQNLVNFNLRNDAGPALVWGAALWLLSGSRSNPLATPLANVLYDEREEGWLRDRNAGLFAPPPAPLLVLLGLAYACLGTAAQFLCLQLAEGDSGVCGQLAGVSLIGGIFLEVGRLASGEKGLTRDEMDRAVMLKDEFDEFATKRLIPGGNCHRSDVVKSFRRYHAKYRQADSTEYPLTDLEIEKLLRGWNRSENRGQAEMTSAGFYYGIQINTDADVFAR